MPNAPASKLTRKSSWLALLLGGAFAALTAQSCSVDTGKYTFVPDDEFADANVHGGQSSGGNHAGGINGGGMHAGGTSGANSASGASGDSTNAGDGNMSAGANSANCTSGEHACTADGHLQTCQAGDPPAFDAGQACGSANKCSVALGLCLACVPGEFQCANNVLQQCNILGSAFEQSQTCDSKTACIATGQKGYCVRCKPSAGSCEPSDVHILASTDDQATYPSNRVVACNAEGWGTDTSATCQAESPICDPTNQKCLTCQPNLAFCIGSTLNQCSADGQDYSYKLSCQAPAVCDAASGRCVSPPNPICNTGSYQCSGADLQYCKDGTRWDTLDTCASKTLCDPNAGRCQACALNNAVCVNDNVQICGSNFQQNISYIPQQCAAGQCAPAGTGANCNVCRPGTISCYDGSPNYGDCSLTGYQPKTCPRLAGGAQSVCSSALQKCVACLPGSYTCDQNQFLRRCLDDGSGLKDVIDCSATGQRCDAGRGICTNAQPGQTFCDPRGDLYTVGYDTNHKLINKLLASCGSFSQCDQGAGKCRDKRCVVGQTTCVGADLYTCDASSDRRIRSGTRCASAARCQDGFGCVKVLSLGAGDAHTCAIVAGADATEGDPGYLMCWGANESGQLGDGSPLLADSKEPRPVLVSPGQGNPKLSNYFSSVCGGKNFSCAELVASDAPGEKRIACWGSNEKGQLGVASTQPGPYNAPFERVADVPTNDKGLNLHAVTCGAEFACALGPDGKAWCWGANESGQLGNGRAGVPGIGAAAIEGFAFTELTAGARHVCGTKADNTVWCWGDGSLGQLGNGTTKGSATPTVVSKVTAASDRPLALGNDFTLALGAKAAKNPFAWGANTFGQLANDTRTSTLVPGALPGFLVADFLGGSALYTGATAEHACARIVDRLYCWGANVFGEVGDDSAEDRTSPTLILDGKLDTTKLAPGNHSVAVGGRHTCALTAKGDVLCWGANHRSQLGTSALTPQMRPTKSY